MKFGSNKSPLRYLSGKVDFVNVLSNSQQSARAATIAFEYGIPEASKEAKDVFYWTKPFYEAYISAKKSIASALNSEKVDDTGTYTGVNCWSSDNGEVVVIYSFDRVKSDGQDYYKNSFFAWFVNGSLIGLVVTKKGDEHPYYFESNVMAESNISIGQLMNDIVAMEVFKKVCRIEIKVLLPNQKEKLFNCKYANTLDRKVQILNSTWFTTLVKSESFKVRGHFRLQPKKKDEKWIKELIWINDFQKEGYTAPAKKLKDL